MKHSSLIRRALVCSLPVLVGYGMIGFGFGILMHIAGYGLWWAVAMSLTIYAGSLQFVGVSLLTAPASLLTTLLTTLMINARHLFYGISMIGRYQGAGRRKPYLIFALTDETYAIVSGPLPCREEDRQQFSFLVSLFHHVYWVLGTALGSLVASALPFDTRGIEFSMTALFAAAYTDQWFTPKNRIPGLLGLGISILCLLFFGSRVFLIPSMAVILLVLLLRKPGQGKEADCHEF